MAGFREVYEEDDNTRMPLAERPPAVTPLQELARGDGYRSASLDVADLDPPTSLPPY